MDGWPALVEDEEEEGPRSKRAAILDAAIACFGEFGYEATKWGTVADRVGIGQTALYHYFESKAHCLLTIMRLELARSHERFLAATGLAATHPAKLRAAVRVAYAVSEQEVLQLRILQSHMSLLAAPAKSAREEAERQVCRALVHQIEHDWTELLRAGMADGSFPRRDPRQVTLALLGVIVSVWRWYRPGGQASLDDIGAFIEGCCVRLVGR